MRNIMDKLTEEQLLNMAKGVGMENVIDEAAQINEFKEKWQTVEKTNSKRLDQRRRLRKAMFFVIKQVVRETEQNLTLEHIALKEIIESQLDKNLGMDWLGFTFVWDVHPHGIPIIVRKEAWVREGGGFDPELGNHFPSAFTGQVIE